MVFAEVILTFLYVWVRVIGTASKQSFEEFQQGFANIVSIVEEVGKPGSLEGQQARYILKFPLLSRMLVAMELHSVFVVAISCNESIRFLAQLQTNVDGISTWTIFLLSSNWF